MRRYFFYQTVFFFTISLVGVVVSLYLMKDALRDLTEIQTASTSMAQRHLLFNEIERIGEDRAYLPEGIKNIKRAIHGCGKCHATDEHRTAINELETSLKGLEKAYLQDRPIGPALKRLKDVANKAALRGAEDILREARNIPPKIRIWGIISDAVIITLFGGFFFISLVLQKKASRYFQSLIRAIESISKGKQIGLKAFKDEFKPVGEALQRMQTQIKASEEKLRNWAEAWQKTFDTIEEMIAICDSRGMVIQANRAFKRTFGKDSEGMFLNSLLLERLKSDISREIAKTLTMAERPMGEIDSEEGFFRWALYPVLGLKGEITGIIWICRDMTKERELEERALQAEKLVALGELVAGVAHELNNPMSVVVGYSEILKDMEGLPEDVRDKINRIFESAERASGIVRALLDISRKKPPRVERIKIEPVIKTILELMEYEFRSDGIQIETGFEETPVIEVDPIHIKQIAVNLLKNAHDAVLERPTGRKISLRTFVEEDHVCFQVRDNGPGIPEERRHRIFEPFFTTKDVGKGTGLGLYSVYNLVSMYKGEVIVSNHPEGGAVFTVHLPLGDQQSPA